MTSTHFYSPNSTSFPLDLHEEEDHHHQHHQLFHLKPQASSSSSSSSPSLSNSILFNSNQDQQGGTCYYRDSQRIDYQLQEGNIFVPQDGSCDQPSMLQTESTNSGIKLCINLMNDASGNRNGNPSESSSVKLMSSKMRLMKKMMDSDQIVAADHSTRSSENHKHQSTISQIDNYKDQNLYNNGNNTIRVCADCNTTKTPLWRSGPRGPKSLCNACGIRQRKARRAMGTAANGGVEPPPPSMKRDHKGKHKNKRSSDESYNTSLPIKKRYKIASQPSRGRKKICFEDLPIILSKNSTAYQQVFPQDEREAATLLMALSYGLVHG
ncbi:hypothetical protein HS088_TW04G00436 [Tripterygium wilfordii]|uniref:GATA-type domain-containing protein n=1 Tax=Tripterygium wilfordii TaxID=458696 RepID=A0A7J7DQ72_TRIWF|nr:GATA transcription factor 21-like [Tripterygium wilfordii]KAF5748481.1 hypothetical protein HS088_TW04G00436 [Tripterygium wilfordii]